LVSATQLDDLELPEDLFDDFCVWPFQPRELEARLKHLFWRTGRGTRPELIEYGPLVLNLETYQAAVDARPLDRTYVEHALRTVRGDPARQVASPTVHSRPIPVISALVPPPALVSAACSSSKKTPTGQTASASTAAPTKVPPTSAAPGAPAAATKTAITTED